MDLPDAAAVGFDGLLEREWLATNGLGGFACSTVPGLNTRKYHGLLVAAMFPPVRRMVLLSRAEEVVYVDGWPHPLSTNEYPGTIHPEGYRQLRAFDHHPYPRWGFQGDGWTLEKSLRLVRGQNTVVLTYTLLGGTSGKPIALEVRPLLALRPIHELMYQWNARLAAEPKGKDHHRVPPTGRTPETFFAHEGTFDPAAAAWYLNTIYRREEERGYAGLEDLWCPGAVRFALEPGRSVHFACSTEPIELQRTIELVNRQYEPPRESASESPSWSPSLASVRPEDASLDALVRAAGQFVLSISSSDAAAGSAGALAAVMTNIPWATPSGRDALIAFPGLLLATGRFAEAKSLLLWLASHLRDGRVPSEFTEDKGEPRYVGVDTSLWFVNAVYQYLDYSGDDEPGARRLLDAVAHVMEAYRRAAAPDLTVGGDGLLSSHVAGTPTTWMDAKIGDWVVTPRAGRPVELNALWYNALRAAASLAERFGPTGWDREYAALAARVRASFNDAFWNAHGRCCYDVVADHGPDPSVRPNQLLAMSLPFPVLDVARFAAALETVTRELLVPTGVRTLAPSDPAYRGRYGGDVVSRDRAYHNGSAYPWLLGPYVTAYLRVHGRGPQARREAAALLEPCLAYLRGDGLGKICELFDGDPPHRPGGALASARATGELLRCYVEDVLDLSSGRVPHAPHAPHVDPGVPDGPAVIR